MLLLLATMSVAAGIWQWNRPHEDYEGRQEETLVSASELVRACVSGQSDHWSEKVIRVSGTLSDTTDGLWILAPGVAIRMRGSGQDEVILGQEISVKARFLAYDDLLGEVRMDFGTTH